VILLAFAVTCVAIGWLGGSALVFSVMYIRCRKG
jgi:hypothetical protein